MRQRIVPSLLLGLLAAGVVISLGVGRYPVSIPEMGAYLGHVLFRLTAMDEQKLQMVSILLLQIRMPRILAAMLVGAALSVSGAAFQAMFVNPLVSPGLLGVLAGASFGAALGMVISTSWLIVQATSVSFGLLAVLLALLLSRFYRGDRILLLVLGGIISGALFTSLLSIVKILADPYSQLPAIVYWLMGGFSMVDGKSALTLAPPIVGGILVLLLLSEKLNVLTMGDEEARSMGIHVTELRITLILTATFISSLTVALGGIIGWVGLVIPHIGRMLVGPDNHILLPVSTLLGALFLLVVDNASRLLFTVEIPIGILTALLGIPVFAVILRTSKKGWS
ncbi:iron ABC transporter permease [Desulforhabdus sp. TSK]|uniref:FecCD family ABC transporter permease n=1 Tax=Desulforhabdus sp. TSK TaxID=2925014 RepID=UPI001FC8C040|nr:iron ABC transporter permease [Desulforhabdus sp. TSK]GKT10938.1 iron ABC transporter permease [Desulforhabdus sp. TSK]